MEPARRKQFVHLSDARQQLLGWAIANGIPLVRVEYVVPFIQTEFGTSVWLFYDTDASVASCADAGTTANVQEKFLAILADSGYPGDWLADTSFKVDSRENVERNFDGSYFYRLR